MRCPPSRPARPAVRQSGNLFLIDVAGGVLAQGGRHPSGDLGVLQSFSGDDGADDDLAAGIAGLLSGLEAVQLGLCLGDLLVNGPGHFEILWSLNGCKFGCPECRVQDTKCPLIQTLRVCVGKGTPAFPLNP